MVKGCKVFKTLEFPPDHLVVVVVARDFGVEISDFWSDSRSYRLSESDSESEFQKIEVGPRIRSYLYLIF